MNVVFFVEGTEVLLELRKVFVERVRLHEGRTIGSVYHTMNSNAVATTIEFFCIEAEQHLGLITNQRVMALEVKHH
jgi:hypothetical protein